MSEEETDDIMREEISKIYEVIDIIPIKLNEPLPKKEKHLHIEFVGRSYTIEELTHRIKHEIKRKFGEYDSLILLKNNIVIGVI